jgi:hypothetical protein
MWGGERRRTHEVREFASRVVVELESFQLDDEHGRESPDGKASPKTQQQ